MATNRSLVLYVIDEATDDVSATVQESVRLVRQLHLWEGSPPSMFDGAPEGSPRTVGVGLHFDDPFPIGDRAGVIRLLEYVTVAAATLGVCFEVQLDGSPLGLVAPEGIQAWVAEALRSEFGLADVA